MRKIITYIFLKSKVKLMILKYWPPKFLSRHGQFLADGTGLVLLRMAAACNLCLKFKERSPKNGVFSLMTKHEHFHFPRSRVTYAEK